MKPITEQQNPAGMARLISAPNRLPSGFNPVHAPSGEWSDQSFPVHFGGYIWSARIITHTPVTIIAIKGTCPKHIINIG